MFIGRLYYENEKNYIDIQLIEREDEASIRAKTTWDDLGEWTIDAIARKSGDFFSTPIVFPVSNSGLKSEFSASISFKITARSNKRIEIKGAWREQGVPWIFSGELEEG
jgi:hypothetical protein